MATPSRLDPGTDQESVWDYPRPPALQPSSRKVRVTVDGLVIAESDQAYRVMETYHPPSWYLPPTDIDLARLVPVEGGSFCEWKGLAVYADVASRSGRISRAAWSYPDPSRRYEAIRDHWSFYPGLVTCTVDGDVVEPQPGVFYGGWVTNDVTGPFKGSPGMDGW